MSRSVYSVSMLNAQVGDGESASSSSVPAGTLWVIRAIDIAALSSCGPIYIGCNLTNGEPAQLSALAENDEYHKDTRQVLYEGDGITAYSSSGSFAVMVSGYQLNLP